MRRLTLILSDLYLPGEVQEPALPDTAPLPALEWLLRFAAAPQPLDDWRRWLARSLGATDLAPLPPAMVCAAAAGLQSSAVWLASPVHLEARLDHVRLADRGLLQLTAEERATLREQFAGTFGPQLQLHELGARAFLLEGVGYPSLRSTDPARLLDADVHPALPSGPSAGELRRLQAEMEMWLNTLALNEVRERARRRRVTGLWLWGGGGGAVSAVPACPAGIWGGDPWLRALSVLVQSPSGPAADPPSHYAALAAQSQSQAVVEFAPMSGQSGETLAQLDTNWFSPAVAALESGALQSVQLVANDRVYLVTGKAGWKFWRRRRNWLESLARSLA